MKSFKNLWTKFYSEENLMIAIKNSSKGGKKKKRKDVQRAFENMEKFKKRVWKLLDDYKPPKHNPKTIYDGIKKKKRTIIVPTYSEQVVQHMLINATKEVFLQGVYEHAYGSIPGRGIQQAKRAIERWRKQDRANFKYCLKLDIKKYFENIPHEILKMKLGKVIKDDGILKVFNAIIDSVDTGLPLGFYTSQWLAMWYLKDLDHFIKEKCYAPHYVRYMDDIVILGANKKKLHKTWADIELYLETLGLQLNKRSQLFRTNYIYSKRERGRDVDFMGFRFFRNRTIMRKNMYFKMLRKVRKISKKIKPSIFETRQMLSYLGWIKEADVYNVYLKYIKPYYNIRKAKKRISDYDRRMNGWNGRCPKATTA